ncbi:MAG: type II toxin-antitoxin system RelB/DinJ family antitoxin [Veillonellaceae bacterium]|nr:type II toxin-antitoxin system RelB/DinJ family antitoxin [Veillonellaceae bacterium]
MYQDGFCHVASFLRGSRTEFEAFCNDVGLTMTAAFNVFAKKAVSEQRIPFSIGKDLPNQETLEALAEAKRMKADPNYGKRYKDVDAMIKELLSDV